MFLDDLKITNIEQQRDNLQQDSNIENYIMELFTTKDSSPLKKGYGSNLVKNIGDYFNKYKIIYYIKNEVELLKKYNITDVNIEDIKQTGNDIEIQLILTTNNIRMNTQINTTWEGINYTSNDIFE